MARTIIVGVDDSDESRAAARWAVDEAGRRGASLEIVQVYDSRAFPYGPIVDEQAARRWCEENTAAVADHVARHHPGVRTSTRTLFGRPDALLAETAAAAEADMLVLGSRGLGSVIGFIVGSVALPTAAHARCPVVLVRGTPAPGAEPEPASSVGAEPQEAAAADAAAPLPVLLGLRLDRPAGELLSFAFETAAFRSAALRVVHVWDLPTSSGVRPFSVSPFLVREINEEKAAAVEELMIPWREKFPGVRLDCRAMVGRTSRELVRAASESAMVIVGRRIRRTPFGGHLGAVPHAVMHHARPPVAVVPHS